MDDQQLKSILAAEKEAAKSEGGGDLAKQRSMALDFYLGDLKDHLPAPEGRSSAVSTDVADTVDAMLPSLMDIFASTDEVAKFEAVGPEDEEAAQQETDYVNHVFYNDNEGFKTLYQSLKDALIQKNCIAKFWWEETESEKRETYRSLPADAFAMLVADKSVELIEHSDNEDGTHDATVIARVPSGGVKIMAVPPEEFIISRRARSIGEAPYCAHVTRKTASELIEEGYDAKLIDDLPGETGQATEFEEVNRNTVENEEANSSLHLNRAMREIEVTEHYIRVDYDGDGVAELRKVTTAGSKTQILDNEPCDRVPFAGGTPIIMSHRFWGRGIADVVMDLQRIKTALIRGALDNFYFANNGRMEVAESHATEHTIDDLLTNRPGGLVRTKAPGGLIPIATATIAQHAFPLIEYIDGQREVRTGVQRYAAGPDANTLNPFNSTATGANIVATHAQQRLRLIARVFAETFVKDLMLGIHELILKHGEQARQIKLRDQWVTVDPRNWKTRKDLAIMVGLGTGTRDQQHNMLTTLLQTQVKAIEMQGGTQGIVTMENVYNTLKKMVENAGFRSADPFFTNPAGKPPPEPPPNPEMMKLQADVQAKQADIQLKAQDGQNKLGLEQAKAEQQIQIEREKLAMEREKMVAELAMERERMAFEFDLKRQEAQVNVTLKAQQAEQDIELRRASAANDAEVKREIAKSKSQAVTVKSDGKEPVNVHYDGIDDIKGQVGEIGQGMSGLSEGLAQLGAGMAAMAAALTRPKQIIRGPDGRAVGVQ